MVDLTRILAVPESDLRKDGSTWAIERIQDQLRRTPQHRREFVERSLLKDPRIKSAIPQELALIERRRNAFALYGAHEAESLRAEFAWRKRRIEGEHMPNIERTAKKLEKAMSGRKIVMLQDVVGAAEAESQRLDDSLAIFEEFMGKAQKKHAARMRPDDASQLAFWDAVKMVRDIAGSANDTLAIEMRYLNNVVLTPFEREYGSGTLDEEKRKKDFESFVMELIDPREKAVKEARARLEAELARVRLIESGLKSLQGLLADSLRRQDAREAAYTRNLLDEIYFREGVTGMAATLARRHEAVGIDVKIGMQQAETTVPTMLRQEVAADVVVTPGMSIDPAFR